MSVTDPNHVVAELAIQVPPHHVLYSFAFLVSSVSVPLSFLPPPFFFLSPAHVLIHARRSFCAFPLFFFSFSFLTLLLIGPFT